MMLTRTYKVATGSGAASSIRLRNFAAFILLPVMVAATLLSRSVQRMGNTITSKMIEVNTVSSTSTDSEKEGQLGSDLESSNEVVRLVVISDTHGT